MPQILCGSFFVRGLKEMNNDEIKELPETKALMYIREIYEEEGKLKEMNEEQRCL